MEPLRLRLLLRLGTLTGNGEAASGPFQAYVLRVHPPGSGARPGPPAEYRALARAMQSADRGLATAAGGSEPGCFTGAAAVEWLLQRHPVLRETPDREKALALGRTLLKFGLIFAVGGSHGFDDDEDLLYRFDERSAVPQVRLSF